MHKFHAQNSSPFLRIHFMQIPNKASWARSVFISIKDAKRFSHFYLFLIIPFQLLHTICFKNRQDTATLPIWLDKPELNVFKADAGVRLESAKLLDRSTGQLFHSESKLSIVKQYSTNVSMYIFLLFIHCQYSAPCNCEEKAASMGRPVAPERTLDWSIYYYKLL